MKSSARKNCTKFEPQTWRPSRCKNCFRSEAQHQAGGSEDTPGKSDAPQQRAQPQPGPAIPVDSPAQQSATNGNNNTQDKNTAAESAVVGESAPPAPSAAADAGFQSGVAVSPPPPPATLTYVAAHTHTNFGGPGDGVPDRASPAAAPSTVASPATEGDGWAGGGGFEDISRSAVSPATPPESPVDSGGDRQRSFHLIRRQRSNEGSDSDSRRRRRRRESVDDAYGEMTREDALAEGTRLMLETLRDKLGVMEDRCDRLDREKAALGDLLAVRKAEFTERDLENRGLLDQLEDKVIRLTAENERLVERLNLPENERHSLRDQENDIVDLRTKLECTETCVIEMAEEKQNLQQEINDLHMEMEEMHDQFRDDEALEFREIQKELEATAKNCRILQFKLRKADRRNELIESERVQYEEKIRQLERRFESDDRGPLRELEEELRMAKEVSVRLHDELEMVEERRIKSDEELARVQDYLRESESRRLALQQEVEHLNDEVEQLRERLSKDELGKLDIPMERPMLRKIGSQGSTEKDIEQLMRDLSDHLERENDLKEQLNNAEAENSINRKKMSVLEEENESMNLQLQKMASARKHFKSGDMKPVITEEAHEMSLQLELMDNELSILRRKMEETEKENDDLQTEVVFLRDKMAARGGSPMSPHEEKPDERPHEERIQAMSMDIDELKWKLIQKDQQVEKLIKSKEDTTKKTLLKKSKSLDSDATLDIRKQLESVQLEATVLKEKVQSLELQNDLLIRENQKLQMSTRKVPVVQADDSALQNIELKDKVTTLEAENSMLKRTVKDKTDRLARLASGVRSRDDVEESRDLVDALQGAEREISDLRSHTASLEARVSRIMSELCQLSGKSAEEWSRELSLDTDMRLAERVKDLESELHSMAEIVRNREEENERMLEEMNGYREDIDNMMETFRGRERELLDEIQMLSNKNSVISNLLDMVTERQAGASLSSEASVSTPVTPASPATTRGNPSTVSTLSDVSVGSDDVFAGDKAHTRELDEQFLRRIAWLEQLLEEEKKKTAAAARQANLEESQSAMTDDAKLFEREKDILQKELTLCQKQLTETNDLVKDLKMRLHNVEQSREDIRKDYDKATKDLERERQHRLDRMLEEEKQKQEVEAEAKKAATMTKRMSTGSIRPDKEPASWRWEKQSLERDIKDWKKKADELDAKLRKQSTKLKTVDGKDKEEKLREEIDKLKLERDKIKEERDKLRAKADEFELTLKEVQETLGQKSKLWESERDILENDKKAAEKEANSKDDVIKQKDDIIHQKDILVKQKEVALKEREESISAKENMIKQKEEEFIKRTETIRQKEDEFTKTKDILQSKEELVIDLEKNLKTLDENLRNRDERIHEKNDLIENLNKNVSEKEVRASIMERSMNEANEKLRDKDAELEEIKSVADDYAKKASTFEEQLRDLEDSLNKVMRERDKETASLVIQREKLENQLEYVTREKKCLEDEIALLRSSLDEKETDWRRQKSKYESDLSKLKEKLISLEKLHSSGENAAMNELSQEKERLIKDRGRLEDVIKKLRGEVEKCREAQAEEVAELRKVLYESKKKLDDSRRQVAQLKLELASCKEQHGDASRTGGSNLCETPDPSTVTSPSICLSPLSPFSPDTSFDTPDFSGAMERQELLFRAEKIGMEELYEARLRVLQEQLSQAQIEAANLRSEVNTHKELIDNASKTLSEFKNKYDIDVTSWNDERVMLEKKAAEGILHKKQHDETQKSIEHIALKLRDAEMGRREFENMLTLERKHWEVEVAALKKELTTLRKALGRDVKEDNGMKEVQTILSETQGLVQRISNTLVDSDTSHQAELKAMKDKTDQSRREWERDRKDQEDRYSKLEERNKQLAPMQRSLIDLQYKLHAHRESWLRERTELQKQVDEARRSHLEEKQKFMDLIAEVKRVKALVPILEDEKKLSIEPTSRPGSASAASETHRSETVIRLSSSTSSSMSSTSTAMMIDQALDHITQLAEDLSQGPPRRQSKSRAPPAFQRSVSSSEVESEIAMQQLIALESQPGDLDRSDWSRKSAPASTLSASKRLDQMLRSRSLERSPSPEDEESPPAHDQVADPRSRPVMRRPEICESSYVTGSLERSSRKAKRSSMHSSGTQSAYSSRDASPEKGQPRKSPYPAPPPSFFITPPRSPRHFQPSPHCSILTSSNMMKLYAKLGAIDRHTSTDSLDSNASMGLSASAAIAQERTAAFRVLAKSASMDNPDEDQDWRRSGNTLPEHMTYIQMKKSSKTFEDAPLSETLPASIRIGELIITPGIEKLCKGIVSKKAKGVKSPKQHRKLVSAVSGISEADEPAHRPSLLRSRSVEPATFAVIKPKTERFAQRMLPFLSRARSEDKDVEERKERGKSPKPGFFSSVMDKKRSLFRRSSSTDAPQGASSVVESSIAHAGVLAATHAAPSTCQELGIDAKDTVEEKAEKKSHRRTPSFDFHSVFKNTRGTPEPEDTSDRGRSKDQKDKDSKKKEKKRESSKARDESKESKSRKKEKKRESSKTRDESTDSSQKKEKKRDSSKSRGDSSDREDKKKDKKKKKDKDKEKSKESKSKVVTKPPLPSSRR